MCITNALAADSPFPIKPIRFILGYPPGGASDAVDAATASAAPLRHQAQHIIAPDGTQIGLRIAVVDDALEMVFAGAIRIV